ncbi:hypothetical protein EDB87DRAFT_1638551 [Lactarius vividus]|nr:hypothetical protein EDB87DRAFT_1638551 [Lactarius vividus]
MLNATTGSSEIKSHVDFANNSVINEEGWICGTAGELLITSLHRPNTIWVIGEYETCLDLSTFVHGQSWTTCLNA